MSKVLKIRIVKKVLAVALFLFAIQGAFAQSFNQNAIDTYRNSRTTYDNIVLHAKELLGEENKELLVTAINLQCDAYQEMVNIFLSDDLDVEVLQSGRELLVYEGYDTYMVTFSETHIDWDMLLTYYKMNAK